jgi:hypothetical protein
MGVQLVGCPGPCHPLRTVDQREQARLSGTRVLRQSVPDSHLHARTGTDSDRPAGTCRMTAIARGLRQLRRARGLTQEELATAAADAGGKRGLAPARPRPRGAL